MNNVTIVKSHDAIELQKFKENIDMEIAWEFSIKGPENYDKETENELNYYEKVQRDKTNNEKEKCSVCGSINVIIEELCNTVCINCGNIMNNIKIDPKAEWNNYQNTEGFNSNPVRCGPSINPLFPKWSMSTLIDGNSRLAKRSKWVQMPPDEKALYKKFKYIDSVCNGHFSNNVIEKSKRMFKKVKDLMGNKSECQLGICIECKLNLLPCNSLKISGIYAGYYDDKLDKLEFFTPFVIKNKTGIKRADRLTSIMANCVKRAAKEENESVITRQRIPELFKINTQHMSDGEKYVVHALDGNLIATHKKTNAPTKANIQELAIGACNKLKMSKQQIGEVIKLIDWITKNKLLSSRAPISVAAGCIYYTSVFNQLDVKENLTSYRISNLCNVSTNTIIKIYENIDEIIIKYRKRVEEKLRKEN